MLLLAVTLFAALTAAPPVTPVQTDHIDLWPRVEAARDDAGLLRITDVTRRGFAWRPALEASAGHDASRLRPAVLWLRLRIAPRETGTYYLLASWHALDATLYVPRDRGGFEVLHSGGDVPIARKARPEPQNLIPIPRYALDGRTLYLRTASSFARNSVLQVEGEASRASQARDWNESFNGYLLVLAGFVLGFCALNAVLAIRLRRVTYAYYAVAVGAAALQVLVLTGDAWKWLWPTLPVDYDLAFYATYALAIGSAAIFGRAFLDLKNTLPLLDGITLTGLGLFLAVNAIELMAPEALVASGTYDVAEMLATTAVFGPLIVAGAMRWRRGDREASLYVLAAASVLIGNVLGEAGRELLIPQTIPIRLAPTLGFALEALLLSLALADRVQSFERGALQDGLTSLANRRAFDARLAAERSRSNRTRTPFALLMLDVDRFKAYNDRYGHPAGDVVLRRIAGALAGEVRGIDCAARYGGEEFVALLVNTDCGAAAVVAERVCAAVRTLGIVHGDGPAGIVTVSIGVAEWRPDGSDAVVCADAALYEAKSAGRDRVAVAAPAESVTA